MSLNDLLKQNIGKKADRAKEDINWHSFSMMFSLGTRIVLIYLFFIYVVGNFIAGLLGFNNLYFISIILATLFNIYVVVRLVKDINKKP